MPDDRDPYKWAGRVGVDSGPVPLSRWRGNTMNVTVEDNPEDAVRTSDNRIADQQLRPETRPAQETNKVKGARKTKK